MFAGSQSELDCSAILLSIISNSKLLKVEPWARLNAVVKELPIRLASINSAPDKPPDLSDLFPDAWLKAHPEHRWEIDDIRKVERDRSRQQKICKRPAQGR